MPQQHLVVDVLRVADLLGLALEGEQVDELQFVGGVGGAVS